MFALPGKPSIIHSGSFPPLMELVPLIRICMVLPGSDPVVRTSTPARRPCKAWATLLLENEFSSSPFTEATAPVKSLLRTAP